ncbi:biotin-dependent carboxyltransferase family protein [Bacillus sp. CGMCC 1.16607]|uniref:5-oxoprolinase subunit C family protein n=1 Tax=Bacillus sp. CGMCC 1.16607 TaxID=3351842 RepID=UPI0036280F2C
MGVIIEKPGLLTTVQDLGRSGYQRDGIMVSGAMDTLSMRLANILVGNDDGEAVLEVTLIGPTLVFTIDTFIAITGAHISPMINQIPIQMHRPIFVKSGDKLTFGTIQSGCRSYVAFKGGIHVPKLLGSRSTHLTAKFGGLNGGPLTRNAILTIKSFDYRNVPIHKWRLSSYYQQIVFNQDPIRFIKGRQYHLFKEESKRNFTTSTYILSKDANRIGYRFNGPELLLTNQQEMLTEGVTFGSVQVPANGKPIILMADRQPTGGYPKIAQIIACDLPRLAQLKPGDSVSFSEISMKQAQALAYEREKELKALRKIILNIWKECINKC